MKLDAPRGRLYDALKVMQHRWEELLLVWNDPVQKQFDETVRIPLENLTTELLRAMDRLGQIFAEARRDCDDDNLLRTIYS